MKEWTNEWMNDWTSERMIECMNVWMYEWMNEWKDTILQTSHTSVTHVTNQPTYKTNRVVSHTSTCQLVNHQIGDDGCGGIIQLYYSARDLKAGRKNANHVCLTERLDLWPQPSSASANAPHAVSYCTLRFARTFLLLRKRVYRRW